LPLCSRARPPRMWKNGKKIWYPNPELNIDD
jgi:hypothetical protein